MAGIYARYTWLRCSTSSTCVHKISSPHHAPIKFSPTSHPTPINGGGWGGSYHFWRLESPVLCYEYMFDQCSTFISTTFTPTITQPILPPQSHHNHTHHNTNTIMKPLQPLLILFINIKSSNFQCCDDVKDYSIDRTLEIQLITAKGNSIIEFGLYVGVWKTS